MALALTGAPALASAACGRALVVERLGVRPVTVERTVVVEVPVAVTRVMTVLAEAPAPVARAPIALRLALPPSTRHLLGWRRRAQAFEARHPGVTVNAVVHPFDRPHGDAPDVYAGLSGGELAELASFHEVAPLDALVAAGPAGQALLPGMLALGAHAGVLAGLPLAGYAPTMTVNLAVLEAAGVARLADTYPARLDDARRLTDPAVGRHGWGAVASLAPLETVAGSSGTDFWTAVRTPGDARRRHAAAWQWYADLIHVARVSPAPGAWDGLLGAHEALASARVAAALLHGWHLEALAGLPNVRHASWDAVPHAAWPGTPPRVPMHADFIAVRAESEAPEAARAFALYAATEGWDTASDPGLPAWLPAVPAAAARWKLAPERLLADRQAWAAPATSASGWAGLEAAVLDAIHRVLALGEPAVDRLEGLSARAGLRAPA